MNLFKITLSLSLAGFLAGCATAVPGPGPSPITAIPGEFHRMAKGETLWRISRIYSVDLDELVSLNKIQDVRRIEHGQIIFIPQTSDKSASAGIKNYEDFIWPLKGKVISTFGQNRENMVNKGMDILAAYDSEIVSSRKGLVSFRAEDLGAFGKTIIIDHGDGFLTVYSKLSKILVDVGQNVLQGERIAKISKATGRNNEGYLHFEIRKGHVPHNPYYYLP